MKVKVLYFASAREASGLSEEAIELDGQGTTDKLMETLILRHPALGSVMKSCVLALNQEYISREELRMLTDGDEIAIIPPLSGG